MNILNKRCPNDPCEISNFISRKVDNLSLNFKVSVNAEFENINWDLSLLIKITKINW